LAERRTITVHAFDDQRVHLALAHLGRLKQGRLLTLCGRLAVTQLSPFAAAAAKAADRCRTCFGKVDEEGSVKAEAAAKPRPAKADKPRPSAKILPGPRPKQGPAPKPVSKAAKDTRRK